MKPLEEMGKFATVVVDPPWPMAKILRDWRPNQVALDYPTMSVIEIAALPVPNVLAHDAFVFLWTTQRFLPFAIDIVQDWGCDYRMTMVWHKAGGIKPPSYPMFNAEFVVVGAKLLPKFTDTLGFRLANNWPRGAHSEKPEGFYDLLRRVTPGPRLDVFGRRRIAGFTSWGDEAPEGPALPDHYQTVFE